MRYKLSKLTQAQTLLQIAMKTSGFYDLSANEADWIQRDVRSREFSSFSRLPIPDNCDYGVISKVIGENNYYLKLTTKNHDIDFIHYDDDANELHFWGEYQNCIRAMNELRYRIQKVSDRDEMKRAEAKRSNAYRAEMLIAPRHIRDAIGDARRPVHRAGGLKLPCLLARPDVDRVQVLIVRTN